MDRVRGRPRTRQTATAYNPQELIQSRAGYSHEGRSLRAWNELPGGFAGDRLWSIFLKALANVRSILTNRLSLYPSPTITGKRGAGQRVSVRHYRKRSRSRLCAASVYADCN